MVRFVFQAEVLYALGGEEPYSKYTSERKKCQVACL